jgi:hypothetical protein
MVDCHAVLAVGARYFKDLGDMLMISWVTALVAVFMVFAIYFLVMGLRIAFSNKELPEPAEGDYEIKIIGRLTKSKLLAVMTPKVNDDKSDNT